MLPEKERRRAQREAADAAKRAVRRARTAAIDEGLRLTGLWLRDVACVADGAGVARHAVDRRRCARTPPDATSTGCARRSRWSTRRAPR